MFKIEDRYKYVKHLAYFILDVEKIMSHQTGIKYSRYGGYATEEFNFFKKVVNMQLINQNSLDVVPNRNIGVNYCFIINDDKKRRDSDNMEKSMNDIISKRFGFDDVNIVTGKKEIIIDKTLKFEKIEVEIYEVERI